MLLFAASASAQDPTKPVLRAGVSVQMLTSAHAVEMRAADALDAKVVAITSSGKVYNGVTAVEPESLGGAIAASTVYVKADARAPFQTVLAVLEALRGKQIALLTASPTKPAPGTLTAPYGIRLNLSE